MSTPEIRQNFSHPSSPQARDPALQARLALSEKIAAEGWRTAQLQPLGLRTLQQDGFPQLTVPAECGGAGLSSLSQLAERLRPYAGADPASTFIATHHVVMTLLLGVQWRTESDPGKKQFLNKVLSSCAAGAWLIAPVSEGPSTYFHTPTSLSLTPVADGFRLNGEKPRGTGIKAGHWIYTSASLTADHPPKRVNLILPANQVQIGREVQYDGWLRGSGTHEVHFSNIFVAPAQVIKTNLHGELSYGSLIGASLFNLLFTSNALGLANAVADVISPIDRSGFDWRYRYQEAVRNQLLQLQPAIGLNDYPTSEKLDLNSGKRFLVKTLLLKSATAAQLQSSFERSAAALTSSAQAKKDPQWPKRMTGEAKALSVLGPLSRKHSLELLDEVLREFPDLMQVIQNDLASAC